MTFHQGRTLSLVVKEPLVIGAGLIDDSLGVKVDRLQVVETAMGGFWSLTFELKDSQTKIEDWVDDGLGRHVELYNPALQCIWEGFASKISANIGSLTLTRGPLLETVANKVKVVYSTVDYSIVPPAVGARDDTAWYEDSDSQVKYGEIQRVVSVGGVQPAEADQIAQTALEELKEPATDEKDNLASSVEPSVTVECLGYVHWLNAYTYSSTTTGTENASTKLQNIITADPNSLLSTDFTDIATNTTAVGAWEQDSRIAWSIVKGITALGDSSFNRYLFGIGTGRKATYSAIPTTAKYQRSLLDPQQSLELYGSGQRVLPWDSEPGEYVFYTDLLIGRSQSSTLRLDPRYLFIEQSSFTIPWALTLDGSKVGRLDQLLAQLGLKGTGA
jgi:hypothetical protein